MKLLVIGSAPLPFALYQLLGKHAALTIRSLRPDIFFLSAKQPYDGVVLWAQTVTFLTAKKIVTEYARRLPDLPVIIAQASYSSADRARLLSAGARECAPAGMGEEEIAIRIRLACRQVRSAPDPLPFVCGDFAFHFDHHTALYQNIPIPLNKKETLLLTALLRRTDHIVSSQLLRDLVWDVNRPPVSNSLEVYISSLRRKIEKPFGLRLIETVKGMGYRVRKTPQRPL